MIQRIQSLYILIVATLTGWLIFANYAVVIFEPNVFSLKFLGVYSFQGGFYNFQNRTMPLEHISTVVPFLILIPISLIVTVIAFFQYKRRTLQISLCWISMALNVGILVTILYQTIKWAKFDVFGNNFFFSFVIAFPIISFVLLFLAIKAIRKDEAKVKAMDRIR